jgi:hypothetical protein
MFDIEGKGWVTVSELKTGLKDLNFPANKDEIYLFIRRFDKDNDGRLRYSDFCEAFTPLDQEYAQVLGERKAYYIHHALSRSEYFEDPTRAEF